MKTILIIDDDEIFQFILAVWLTTEGFNSITAEDGYEGIRLAKTYRPDLIFSDVPLPKINGIEVLKRLRDDLNTSHIPFFFLTSETKLAKNLIQQLEVSGVVSKEAGIDVLRQALSTIKTKEWT